MSEEDAETIKITKYIIKNTPIGHLSKTLENLKSVVGEKIMDEASVKEEIQEYGASHNSQIPLDICPEKVVISNLTKTSEGFYQDQVQKVQFRITSNGIEDAGNIEIECSLRDVLSTKMSEYINSAYKTEITRYNVHYDSLANKLFIVISAHNINLKSYWSGEWLSTFEYDIENHKLSGKLKGDTYYYEEGNVQFNMDTDFEEQTIKADDEETTANEIIKYIDKHENDVQKQLESIYMSFSEDYIKQLRRAMPITKQKMNWNVHQMGIMGAQ